MPRVSRSEFQALKRKTAAKQAKRDDNASFIRKMKRIRSQPIAVCQDRTALKDQIVRLLGLLDRKINGPFCRLDSECPQWPKIGSHHGDCAYHIHPAKSGDAVRLEPMAVVWACSPANLGEMMNRALYAEKHERLFGWNRMDALKKLSRQKVHHSTPYLIELRNKIRAMVEAA